MKKFINNTADTLAETLDGFVFAHSHIVAFGEDRKFVKRRQLSKDKVAIISGGGSGHEPMHVGFVGHGMLDAACVGQIFTSPTPDQIVAAAQAVECGNGTIFIVKNYAGDRMNFDMAEEALSCRVERILVNDDVGLGAIQLPSDRRGVAGTLIVEKIVGAGAEKRWPIEHLKKLGDKTINATRSMGVALTSCTVPAAKKPTFAIDENEIEFGVGIHGEQGSQRVQYKSADNISKEMVAMITQDLNRGGKALLVVNGFGGTPLMELYIVFNACVKQLAKHGIKVERSLVGNYVTSLDMAGCSITVTLLDEEILELWDAPVVTPTLRW
jgi:phosphoenolpyruvate---glycerone phosphotransferase subunit DhaK